MKNKTIQAVGAMVLSVALVSCSNITKQDIGTAGGAVAGGVIGHAIGGSTAGTIIGAAGGALVGNKIGKSMENNN